MCLGLPSLFCCLDSRPKCPTQQFWALQASLGRLDETTLSIVLVVHRTKCTCPPERTVAHQWMQVGDRSREVIDSGRGSQSPTSWSSKSTISSTGSALATSSLRWCSWMMTEEHIGQLSSTKSHFFRQLPWKKWPHGVILALNSMSL